MSVTVKIWHGGVCQEHLFSRVAPIFLGGDDSCDVHLEGEAFRGQRLEVRVVAGEIILKLHGNSDSVKMNNLILSPGEEIKYLAGKVITLVGADYQISLDRLLGEDALPPPFSQEEFQERLESLSRKVRDGESELREVKHGQEERRRDLRALEQQCLKTRSVKNNLDLEVLSLEKSRVHLEEEVRELKVKSLQEEERIDGLRRTVQGLEGEERRYMKIIDVHGNSLMRLKDEITQKERDAEAILQKHAAAAEELRSKEVQLRAVEKARSEAEKDLEAQALKLEKLLGQLESAARERSRIQGEVFRTMQEKESLGREIDNCREALADLGKQKHLADDELQAVELARESMTRRLCEIKDAGDQQSEKNETLALLNQELQAEHLRLDGLLTQKKSTLARLEFEAQDMGRKHSSLNLEIDRSGLRLQDLLREEKTQEVQVRIIEEELVAAKDRHRKELERFEQEQARSAATQNAQKEVLQKEIQGLQLAIKNHESEKNGFLDDIAKLRQEVRETQRSIDEAEKLRAQAWANKAHVEEELVLLRGSVRNLELERGRLQRETARLSLRSSEMEEGYQLRLNETQLELEAMKREERSKIEAERQIALAEAQTLKLKGEAAVEELHRERLQELNDLKVRAQEESFEILRGARLAEQEISRESSRRLKEANEEARAQELEAERIHESAKRAAKDLIKRAEHEGLEEWGRRRSMMRAFLEKKRQRSSASIDRAEQIHREKLQREEARAQERLEAMKRQELKRVAQLREEEVTKVQEARDAAMREVHLLKQSSMKEVELLKKKQEEELGLKRKSSLEHINQRKFELQREWEEQIREEKLAFKESRKQRVENSTQAVLNVLIGKFGPLGDGEAELRERVRSTLEMTINGQNAKVLKEAGQVLDYNPMKRKKIFQVLRKYTLHFVAPAAIALAVVTDTGSLRTKLLDQFQVYLGEKESASDIFVKSQQEAWKEKYTFKPSTTPEFKDSYTDNVLYTTDFVAIMESEEYQNSWILKLHDFMLRDLELSEDIAIGYISSEGAMLKEMAEVRKDINPQFLDTGLKRLQELEATHLGWLSEKIPDTEKLARFKQFRRNHFNDFRAPRSMASEAPVEEHTSVEEKL